MSAAPEERPADARIDDLFVPNFPPEIAEAFEAMKPMADAIEWTPDALMTQAAQETGLDDFGDDLHVEPMAVIVRALDTEAALSHVGRVSQWSTLVKHASNKLLAADLLQRHPEIREIEIARPIVIAGQGRTGTTHLHNLMSSDPALRTLPYWESVEPVPPLAEQGVDHAVDPRWTRVDESLAGLNFVLPYFRRMHDMYPDHVHEEIQLMAAGFSSQLLETMGVMPSWKAWYQATDQTPWYEYCRTMLQILTFLRGGDRWVLKTPQHVEQFGPLMAVFPDAIVVRTHRDPVALAGSMATMLTYTARTSQQASRLPDVGPYWIERAAEMCAAAAAQRDLVPADQVIDVDFDDFMRDDVAMVERIYEVADQPFTADVRAKMDAFMVEHPRGRHGRVIYDVSDFGYTHEQVRTMTAEYCTAFGV